MVPLIVLAAACGVFGLLFLSQATAGVGLIAFGCLLGILARIAQAARSPVVSVPVPSTIPDGRTGFHVPDRGLLIVGLFLGTAALVSVGVLYLLPDRVAELVTALFGD